MSKLDKNLDLQELIDALQDLDPQNMGGWPTPIKIGAAVLVFVLVIFLGYFLEISPKYQTLEQQASRETDLMNQYENKAFKAQNLDQYRKQLDDMEEMFGSLLAQLPKETEVPGLLEDITHTGLGSGLEFKKIDLGKEAVKEFYAELPIQINALGDFHGFGAFVSGVAALPRIVTLDNFTIKPTNNAGPGLLEITITAKTYRYSSAPAAAQRPTARGGKK
jgi:type IV pilus assembly protein PilO